MKTIATIFLLLITITQALFAQQLNPNYVERPAKTKIISLGWGWVFDYAKDQSQLFKDYVGYDYTEYKKDMDIFGVGVAFRSVVTPESKQAKIKSAPSIVSAFFNVGRATAFNYSKRYNENITASFLPESFIYGVSTNGTIPLINDFFAEFVLRYVFSSINNKEIVYTSKGSDALSYPNEVTGYWMTSNWDLKLCRTIFENFKVAFGVESLNYSGDLNYKYKEIVFVDPDANRRIFDITNIGYAGELGWGNERMTLDLSYRFPDSKGIGGYSMYVKYFI